MKIAQRLALTTCLMTILLIAIGAFVRATGSGLGCPDWPTCHGGALPPGSREPMIEFSHRFVGSIVGLLVIATAFVAWRAYRHVPFIIWTATAAVPLVGLQGLLGAITVWTELPPEIVATHLITAMIVLSVELAVFVAMYLEDPDHAGRLQQVVSAPTRRVGQLALISLAWLTVTMWIGGYMAESGASTACEGWPLCNGSVLPASDDHEVTHMVHRYLAGLFLVLVGAVLVVAWRERSRLFWASSVGVSLFVLYVVQVIVGAFNVWYTFPDSLTVAHTLIAALVWFTLAAAVLMTYYTPAKAPASRAVNRRAGATA